MKVGDGYRAAWKARAASNSVLSLAENFNSNDRLVSVLVRALVAPLTEVELKILFVATAGRTQSG